MSRQASNRCVTRPVQAVIIGLALLATLAGASLTRAAEPRVAELRTYRIPGGSLSQALSQFAGAAGVLLSADARLTDGKTSPGLQGELTVAEGFARLLAGHSLAPVRNADGSYTLRPVAQTTETPDPSTASTPEPEVITLPEMTVTASPLDETSYNVPNASTATKTDTPIMETPVNIQVVPQQVLRDQQVIRIDKALQNVSGVYVQPAVGGLQNGFNLRGFGTLNYYRDGVRVLNENITPGARETANLERIEVLKGPASILYGQLQPGGLINLVTKHPLAQPYYALQQQFGSFDFYRTTIDATGPITGDDTLLYRLNLAYENAGSFREFLENERVFVAPVLRWNLSPQTQANFFLEYLHSRDPVDSALIPGLGNGPAPIPVERNLAEPGSVHNIDEVRVGFDWSHAFNQRWTLRHRFDANLADENELGTINVEPIDPQQCSPQRCPVSRRLSAFSVIDREIYYTSLDLTGRFDTFGLAHTLLLGGDFLHQRVDSTGGDLDNPIPPIDVFHPVHTGVPEDARNILRDFLASPAAGPFMNTQEWYGFYLQDQVKLPYHLHLLAGFRYDNATTSAVFPFVLLNSRQHDDAVTPRYGLVWQPIPELSLYGNYVENFNASNGRSGGLFGGGQFGTEGQPLPPETAQQWELGLKTELLDGGLTGSLAWFDLTKQNIQTADPDPIRAAQGFVVVTGEARNRGLELDLVGEVLPGFRLIASGAYIDSEITNDTVDELGNPIGNQGNRFFGVPRLGGSLWGTYEPQAGLWRGLQLGAGLIARGPREVDNANSFELPGYATVNLMAGYQWKVGPSKLSVQLNVDNLLDKETFETFGGNSFFNPGAPRTFLGSVRVEF
ncbi:MAG: TonB-dependent siderophore receptor [Gammaproteobacteria bacterium]